jgi:hypothetical protein
MELKVKSAVVVSIRILPTISVFCSPYNIAAPLPRNKERK